MLAGKVVITNGSASLRQGPYTDSEIIDEVLFGMVVKILAEYDQWVFVETDYSYKGYLNKTDFTLCNPVWETGVKLYCLASFADITAGPKYSSRRIVTIPRGASIVLTGTNQDNWLEVVLPSGEKGWIREEAVEQQQSESANDLRQNLVATALMYLGTQYRWGGKTPMGIDCSGLTSMAYMINGVMLPRDSQDQMNFMRKLQRRESKSGDLLFFPGHVGMYIGEDKFVHATGSENIVKISSLNSSSKLYRQDLDEKYICTGTVF